VTAPPPFNGMTVAGLKKAWNSAERDADAAHQFSFRASRRAAEAELAYLEASGSPLTARMAWLRVMAAELEHQPPKEERDRLLHAMWAERDAQAAKETHL
jgi:hypothetical protein